MGDAASFSFLKQKFTIVERAKIDLIFKHQFIANIKRKILGNKSEEHR